MTKLVKVTEIVGEMRSNRYAGSEPDAFFGADGLPVELAELVPDEARRRWPLGPRGRWRITVEYEPGDAPAESATSAATIRTWELFGGHVRLFESGDALHWDAEEGRWERGWGRWGSVDMTDDDLALDAEWEAAVEAYRIRPPTGATEPR